jgi:hypothetical protein
VSAGIPPELKLFYDFNGEEIPAMGDGCGLAEAMLGLDHVRVIDVREVCGEVTMEVKTTKAFAKCETCGCRAESQDRMRAEVRNLECSAQTWTEPLEFLDSHVVLRRYTGAEACRGVGELARPVWQIADEFGVSWETVMNAVVKQGTPLSSEPFANLGWMRRRFCERIETDTFFPWQEISPSHCSPSSLT